MSDRVLVLTQRPGTIKDMQKIEFDIKNRNPINCRESPKFSKYFDTIWKELDVHVWEKHIWRKKKILKTNK